jgi:hypothetical protein
MFGIFSLSNSYHRRNETGTKKREVGGTIHEYTPVMKTSVRSTTSALKTYCTLKDLN